MLTKSGYSPIGLDINSNKIRLLQLKKQAGTFFVHSASQVEIKSNQDKEVLFNKLKELIKSAQIKGKQTIVTLPTGYITSTPFTFSLKEDEDAEQAILREAGNYLSSPLEENVIDYLNLPSFDQRPHKSALLIAAKREDILWYFEVLQQVGLNPLAIEPRYMSLFRTINYLQETSIKDQFIFYIEETGTIIMTIVDEKILVVREIPWGMEMVKRKIEKVLGLSQDKAEKVLEQYGVEFGKAENKDDEKIGPLTLKELCQVVYEVINPNLEEFCREIQKVLSYCVSVVQQRVINQALLLGKGKMIKSLPHFIQQKTGIKVICQDEANTIMNEQPSFEIALGLALRGMKHA